MTKYPLSRPPIYLEILDNIGEETSKSISGYIGGLCSRPTDIPGDTCVQEIKPLRGYRSTMDLFYYCYQRRNYFFYLDNKNGFFYLDTLYISNIWRGTIKKKMRAPLRAPFHIHTPHICNLKDFLCRRVPLRQMIILKVKNGCVLGEVLGQADIGGGQAAKGHLCGKVMWVFEIAKYRR